MSRIIAGTLGGRRLAAPTGRGTRPTSDRVREAVFARLDHLDALDEAVVLDLFAGSGALGLEALSRGAARVTLVEHDRRAALVCQRNADELGVADRVVVRQSTAHAFVQNDSGPVDLVLLDPPYDLAEAELAALLADLVPLLSAAAVVVVERSTRGPEPTWPTGVVRIDQREYGDTTVWFAEACT